MVTKTDCSCSTTLSGNATLEWRWCRSSREFAVLRGQIVPAEVAWVCGFLGCLCVWCLGCVEPGCLCVWCLGCVVPGCLCVWCLGCRVFMCVCLGCVVPGCLCVWCLGCRVSVCVCVCTSGGVSVC